MENKKVNILVDGEIVARDVPLADCIKVARQWTDKGTVVSIREAKDDER